MVCQFVVHFPWQQALMRSLFFQFAVSQGPCILVQCLVLLIYIRFYWPYLNKVLEMVSFSSQTSRNHFVLYKGRYKSNAFNFFLRNYYYKYNEIDMYQGYILYKLEIVSPQSFHYYQHTFSTFVWDSVMLCWSCKTVEASELFTNTVFQLVIGI